jgi:hypothetical protein
MLEIVASCRLKERAIAAGAERPIERVDAATKAAFEEKRLTNIG